MWMKCGMWYACGQCMYKLHIRFDEKSYHIGIAAVSISCETEEIVNRKKNK